MYAKRLKSDLVELCKQRRLRIGRLTKEQLIAQLEAEDRANELIPVSQGSSLANAAQAPVSVPAGSGQPAAEGFPRPLLPMPRGRVGRSPANTEGAVTPPASRGSPRRSSPASRGSSRRRSASGERNWLEWEKELKLRELEDREQQRQHEERQRQHEREENERQRQENERQHQRELELARLKGSEPPAAVSEGGPRTARSFDKCIMAPYKEGEDMDDFLEAFETACELHRVDPADRLRVLTPLLDPKSVALYRQLGEAEKGDYELFKKALLREFGLTPEMYRERFRSQDKTPEISYLQLAVRMERYASKWAGGAQTKEDLIKLLVLEQLYGRCPSDLRLWLVDRKPENPRHAGQLADEFVKSRSGGGREEPQRNRPAAMQRESHPGTSQRGNMGNPLPRGRPSIRDNRPARGDPRDLSCYYCGRRGHVRAQCPKLKDRLSRPNPHRVNLVEAQTDEGQASHARGADSLSTAQEREGPPASFSGGPDAPDSKFSVYRVGAGLSLRSECLVPLEVDGKKVYGYWDTGAEVTLARPEVVAPDRVVPNTFLTLTGVGGTPFKVPVARVHLKWGAKEGPKDVGVHHHLPTEVLMGGDLEDWPSSPQTALVVTRSQSRRGALRPDLGKDVPPEAPNPSRVGREHPRTGRGVAGASDPADEREQVPIPSSAAEFQAELQKDPSLRKLRGLADLSVGQTMRRGCKERFLWEKGFLYREWAPPGEVESWGIRRQLVVPQKFRHKLLYLAHDIPLAGHQGIRRTRQRLLQNFYWPGVFTNVRQYCRSCDPCQRVGKARDKGKAALRPLPIIEEPFQKVAMDIVGPLSKTTRSGKKYILVVVDFATRYPEAVPLSSIEADTVADALLTIFSRVGFPKEVLTDQGSNFMSALLRCLWERCGVRHNWASAYHPQSNGLVERFNGTLKMMLKTFMNQHPQDWDKYLPHLLFAYREVPQESTGFSPFELLYGRRVRGPLDLMRDEWEGNATPDGESVVEYVLTFRERLAELMGLARENLARAQRKQKVWYDRTARARAFATGDQVMVLIPVRKNKLQAAWEGPFKVVKQLNEVNYVVELSNRAHHHRVYHVNMMKPYYDRGNMVLAVCGQWEGQGDDPLVDLFPGTRVGFPLEAIPLSDRLTPAQRAEIGGVLHLYQQLFSNQPGRTNLTVHRVQTGSHPPIKCSPFRATGKTAQDLEREVNDMLALGVIQPSSSPWASPVVLVPKKDGSIRFCVDYRKLNAITVADAYPMPRPDELLDKLGGARYLTTMDLTKGYWQVPLDADARLKSAFVTPLGLYEFLTLPFGLKGAPATFQRLVDQLLRGMESFAVAYIDDICVFSQTWEDHISQVRQVLDRLQKAGLTVKPEKCKVGMAEVSYLGHRVGSGCLKPEPAKVEVIRDWPAPQTKKQVQAFIGMAGYYRRFVPHFSAIAAPITELCKKGKPDKVVWTEECQEALRALKEALVSGPVLANPDFDKPFMVFTDASDTGLGAVLMQEDEKGERHPIVYLSKKLLPREQNYAAIEKECLAMVWALKKLEPYLFGRHFTVHTDHSPLTWLHQMKGANAKLLRWSLLLQDYDMDVVHVKGRDNLIADALSRRGSPELPQVTGQSDPAQFSLEGGRDVTEQGTLNKPSALLAG
ncbi:uncharacterized protein LOC135981052 [Chrysemys picta bellii]|uniref:uncharacterized protein LOC135981052 n=1 Tax=Chrysemys picta bellii TaxID=8478 RepID=UPI0032B26AD6